MQIPNNASKVFKGILFDVYQFPQLAFDGSTSTYEVVSRRDGVAVIATQGNKILISDEEQAGVGSFVNCICGMSEENEEPLQTAKRELLEESGMATEDWELYKSYDIGWAISWKTHYFIARNVHKVAEQNLDPGERITIRELSFDEFLNLAEKPEFRNRELAHDLLMMKLHPELAEAFKKLLFH